ncbi:hypothetical protein [Mesorhizobium sp.]|uniref:hypothetical protein n=1 Tax=Mesorhizobium sp. TaxID=1871066 RepID=UPI000FEA9BAF|nr:hypothetical protein [Mesorhizobium sp.]RWE78788.1 MAG: hypothetical protein EOS42_04185 [Mesorhizobium sp.]
MRVVLIALLLATSAAYGQDSSGATQESPSVKGNQSAQPNNGSDTTGEIGVPVTIVDTPEQASHAAKREEKADEHDAADLDAQERAAKAAERSAATAERQEVPAWTQIIVGIASTLIAVVALIVSLWTAITGIRTTRAQLRAYVSPVDFDTVITNQNVPPHIEVKITFKNTGQTPARNVRLNLKWGVSRPPFKEDEHATNVSNPEGRGSISSQMAFYAGVLTSPHDAKHPLSQTDIEEILKGNLRFWVFGVIEYDDVFRSSHKTRFRYVMNVEANNIATFSPCTEGNDET